ncbi:retrovirus-related pol polyprotein from transposon TNT 1-94 [Tanacetum coccineum]
MSRIVPPIPPPPVTNPGNTRSPNKVDTFPKDNTNNTGTNNVTLNVIVEDLLQLLDSRGGSHVTNVYAFDVEDFTSWKDSSKAVCTTTQSMWDDLILAHKGPSDTRDTKIAALRLKFNAFKALEETQRLTIQSSTSTALISNLCIQDSASDVEEDTRSNNKFLADLNAEFHDRGLLANQKRFYKRSRRVWLARKPIDKSNETCFASGKQGHFQKDCPTTKTSSPSYPSSNKSYKPKFQSNSSQQHNQNNKNTKKDYRGKYKALKSELVILTTKIDAMSKNKSEKGLIEYPMLDTKPYNYQEVNYEEDDLRRSVWYLDSAYFRHMIGVKQYLHRYLKESSSKVVYGDNSLGDTEGYGSVNCNGITFTRVAYVNDINSPDESPKFSIADDHPVHHEPDDFKPAKIYTEIIHDIPAPQDRWSREKHILLVNILGEHQAGVTIRSRVRDSEAASAHECLYVNFLSEIEPKKLVEALEEEGWIIAMQGELNQFERNKV